MERSRGFPQPVTAVVVALMASVALAACGGSTSARRHRAWTLRADVSFAACVRIHGVPDFPDPEARGGGTDIEIKALSESTEVVGRAEEECRDNPAEIAQQSVVSNAQLAKLQAGALAYARCVRGRGVADFPDPKVTRGPGGHGTEMSLPFGGGAVTPGTPRHRKLTSPTLTRAIKTCSSRIDRATPGLEKKG